MKKAALASLLCVMTFACIHPMTMPASQVRPRRHHHALTPLLGRTIPSVTLDAFAQDKITTVRLEDFRGKWLVLFFYPADFTFVCPTELREMAEFYPKFKEAKAEVVSISTDSAYVHRAWHASNDDVKKVSYPMASDKTGSLSRALGVYRADKGTSIRASFIVDPDGKIVACEMTDDDIGRSASELLRKLQAAKAVREGDGFCPANWHTGDPMIVPK